MERSRDLRKNNKLFVPNTITRDGKGIQTLSSTNSIDRRFKNSVAELSHFTKYPLRPYKKSDVT